MISLLCITRLFRQPGLRWALLSAIAFAATAYCRQVATPVLLGGFLLYCLKDIRYRWVHCLLGILAFVLCCAPWSFRNMEAYGGYALSYHLGPNIFTKLTSYNLQFKDGVNYKQIEQPLENVKNAMNLHNHQVPEHPEDTWDINRIPHVLVDSLVKNHGYTYSRVNSIMIQTSIEGFIHHPIRYSKTVFITLRTLLFDYREMYPSINEVIPVDESSIPFTIRSALRSIVAINSLFAFVFIIVILFKRSNIFNSKNIPLALFCFGFISTSMIQVGFARYAIPWLPFLSMLAAYSISTISEFLKRPVKTKLDLNK